MKIFFSILVSFEYHSFQSQNKKMMAIKKSILQFHSDYCVQLVGKLYRTDHKKIYNIKQYFATSNTFWVLSENEKLLTSFGNPSRISDVDHENKTLKKKC
jgi:hypothetical protein